MEKPLPQITVIRTYSQDFIKSNMYIISKVLFNTNDDNTKKSISFLSSGGFTYYNKPDEKKTLCPIVLKNRSQILKYLNEFFIQKNQQLQESITSYEQNAGIVFFPIHYMQPISVTPVYIVYKSRKILQSWDIFYKIEISAFKNVSSGKTELCNLLDRGISITVSANGIVSGVKYNLLPFSHIRKDEMYKVHNEIGFSPQIVYLLNTDNNLISPFYLSLSERKLIPASKQSFILQEQIVEIFKNPMEFNENRVVVWLGGSNNREVSGNDSNSKSFNIPPPGAKLIRLKPKSEDSLLTPCLYWWNGQYQFGDFLETNLISDYTIVSEYAGYVLQNDIEHLIARTSDYGKKQKEFDNVLESIRLFSKKILSKKQIEDGLIKISTDLMININDKPHTIETLQEAIYQVYNPISEELTFFSDETMIMPLSFEWFDSDNILRDRYERITMDAFGNRFVGTSGEAVYIKEELDKIKNELLELKSFVKQTSLNESSESNWLQTLSADSLEKIKRIIFISDATWHFSEFKKYVDNIAIENSFGTFRLPLLLNVIIHELTVSSPLFLHFATGTKPDGRSTDTHILSEYTKETWNKTNLSGMSIIQYNQDFVDHLYQSHRAYASIALAVIISKTNNL